MNAPATAIDTDDLLQRAAAFRQAPQGPGSTFPVSGYGLIAPQTTEQFEEELAELLTQGVNVSVGIIKMVAGGVVAVGEGVGLGATGPGPGQLEGRVSPFVPDQPREAAGGFLGILPKQLDRPRISAEEAGLPQMVFDSQEEADAAKASGLLARGPEDEAKFQDGVAVLSSFLALGVAGKLSPKLIGSAIENGGFIGRFLDMMPKTLRTAVTVDAPAGAVFGALRKSEDTLDAILIDSVFFAGFGMVLRMFMRGTTPIDLAIEDRLPTVVLRGQALERRTIEVAGPPRPGQNLPLGSADKQALEALTPGRAKPNPTRGLPSAQRKLGAIEIERERGIILAEEIDAINALVRARGLATPDGRTTVIEAAGRAVTTPERASKLGGLRAILGSPDQWHRIGTITGEGFSRIVTGAQDLTSVRHRLMAEASEVLSAVQTELHAAVSGQARRNVTPGAGGLSASQARLRAEVAVGEALDNVFMPGDLPPGTPEAIRKAFEPLRALLEKYRVVLAAQGNAPPSEFGINGYLSHGFVGEYALRDVKTGATRAILDRWGKVKGAAEKLYKAEPNLELELVPRSWQISAVDMEQFGISARGAEVLFDAMEAGVKLGPEDLRMLVNTGSVGSAARKPFFRHAMERRANMPGYTINPFDAINLYVASASRRIAFNTYEAKAELILEAMMKAEGIGAESRTIVAARKYISDVLGRPGRLEEAYRDFFQYAAENVPDVFKPMFEGRASDLKKISGGINYLMAIAKLGWSLPAVVANASQTVNNTATELGYRPVVRGMRMLGDRSQRENVKGLLRAMDLDVVIPQYNPTFRPVPVGGFVLDILNPLYAFSGVEVGNKAIAGLSMYQKGIMSKAQGGLGLHPDQALAAAKKFIRDTQFDYSISGAALVMRGPIGSTIFQFQKFTAKEIGFAMRLRDSPAKMARFAANTTAVGGIGIVMSLPPLKLVDWAVGEIDARGHLPRILGGDKSGRTITERFKDRGVGDIDGSPVQAGQRLLGFGLPGYLGVDLTANLEIGLATEVSGFLGPFPSDLAPLVREVAADIPGALLQMIVDVGGKLSPQQKELMYDKITPVFARRLFNSWRLVNEGAIRKMSDKSLIRQPSDVNKAAALMGMGFTSFEASQFRQHRDVEFRQLKRVLKDREDTLDRLARAHFAGNIGEFNRLVAEAKADLTLPSDAGMQGAIDAQFRDQIDRLVRRMPAEHRQAAIDRVSGIGTTLDP